MSLLESTQDLSGGFYAACHDGPALVLAGDIIIGFTLGPRAGIYLLNRNAARTGGLIHD